MPSWYTRQEHDDAREDCPDDQLGIGRSLLLAPVLVMTTARRWHGRDGRPQWDVLGALEAWNYLRQ